MADSNPIPSNLPVEEKKSFAISPSSGSPSLPLPASQPPINSPLLAKPAVPPVETGSSGSQTAPAPVVAPVRPVRSIVRTMTSDLKALEKGEVPRGIEKQILSGSLAPSSVPPLPQATIPSSAQVKLGKLEEKTVSLPAENKPVITITSPRLAAPTPRPLSPQISSSPVPILPKAPSPVVAPPIPALRPEFKPVPPPSPPLSPAVAVPAPVSPSSAGISIPVSRPSLLVVWQNKKTLILAAMVILTVTSFGYWFLVMRNSGDGRTSITPTVTPTITASPSRPASSGTRLSSFFPVSYPLPISRGEKENLTSIFPEIAELNLFNLTGHILLNPQVENSGEDYQFTAFLERFLIDFPINLLSYIDNGDFDLVLTKQRERFDAEGKLTAATASDARVAIIVRGTDAVEAQKTMQNWENFLASNFQQFFGFPEEASESEFFTNNYQGVTVRYRNFPHPDHSIEYAVLTATSNDDYLIIASSREQIFGIIDTFLGF